jgi:hypothetical protein
LKATIVAPPGLSALPKRATPAIRTRCGGPVTSTVVVSPTLRPPSRALFRSMTTSSSRLGAAPDTSVNVLSSLFSVQLRPSVGAPVAGLPSAFPSLPIRRA